MFDVAVFHLNEELCIGELVASWCSEQLATECEDNYRSHNGPDGPFGHRRLAVSAGLAIAQALHGVAALWVA